MIHLSFSSLNLIHTCPHNWLNKQMGVEQPDNEYTKAGKEAHRIIQDHVSGKIIDKRLAHIKYTFPIVEEKEQDERCKFSFIVTPMIEEDEKFGPRSFHLDTIKNQYEIIGYYDGLDLDKERSLEIKTPIWPLVRFAKSYQRKLYALSNIYLKESVLITAPMDQGKWELEPPKVYPVPMTERDREDALDWIRRGINILESGDLTTDLVDGKCIDYRCYWGRNCQFK